VLLILMLSFTIRAERLAAFLAVLALSSLMTGVAVTLVPAEGAYAYYQPARDLFNQYTANAGVWHRSVFESLRNDATPILDFARVQGLVTFPSFHTTLAIITTWAVRDVRYISIPVLLLNAVVIVSTLPEGGHHLVDICAGGIIAAVAILTVQIYTRPLSRRQMPTAYGLGRPIPYGYVFRLLDPFVRGVRQSMPASAVTEEGLAPTNPALERTRAVAPPGAHS
jgi:membrane-associated phospholipid phosphatase